MLNSFLSVGADERRRAVLVVDEDPSQALRISQALQKAGFELRQASGEAAVLQALKDPALRVVLLDDATRRAMRRSLIVELKDRRPDLDVVLMVVRGDVASAVEGMRMGAADCLVKPLDEHQLHQALVNLFKAQNLQTEIDGLRGQLERQRGVDRILGSSLGIRRAVGLVRKAADFPVSVLLTGESGTGKELFAEALHFLSNRREGPFVAVDCAAIPSELVESELFGSMKGAYTGAVTDRAGRLEEADGGTLFLDEIGNLPMATQMKLLRVLQERQLFRLGGHEARRIDVRLVTATNARLSRAIAGGEFREDLFHRIAEFVVPLPPLRERGFDVELLARFFLHRFNHQFNRQVQGFSPEALRAIRDYAWPGNVRELQNAVKQAVVLAGDWIGLESLPALVASPVPGPAELARGPLPLGPSFQMPEGILPLWQVGQAISTQVERRAITSALEASQWNKAAAAKSLSIHFKTLYRKMREYNIA